MSSPVCSGCPWGFLLLTVSAMTCLALGRPSTQYSIQLLKIPVTRWMCFLLALMTAQFTCASLTASKSARFGLDIPLGPLIHAGCFNTLHTR